MPKTHSFARIQIILDRGFPTATTRCKAGAPLATTQITRPKTAINAGNAVLQGSHARFVAISATIVVREPRKGDRRLEKGRPVFRTRPLAFFGSRVERERGRNPYPSTVLFLSPFLHHPAPPVSPAGLPCMARLPPPPNCGLRQFPLAAYSEGDTPYCSRKHLEK